MPILRKKQNILPDLRSSVAASVVGFVVTCSLCVEEEASVVLPETSVATVVNTPEITKCYDEIWK